MENSTQLAAMSVREFIELLASNAPAPGRRIRFRRGGGYGNRVGLNGGRPHGWKTQVR